MRSCRRRLRLELWQSTGGRRHTAQLKRCRIQPALLRSSRLYNNVQQGCPRYAAPRYAELSCVCCVELCCAGHPVLCHGVLCLQSQSACVSVAVSSRVLPCHIILRPVSLTSLEKHTYIWCAQSAFIHTPCAIDHFVH